MKFTLSWLKNHLDTDEPVASICEALTDLGLEVENVVNPAAVSYTHLTLPTILLV